MQSAAISFTFDPDVPLAEAEQSLHVAMFAVEGLIGRARVRLEAKYRVDTVGRTIVVDTCSAVGRLIVRAFTALLLREFGECAFRVECVDDVSQHHLHKDQTCFSHRSGRAATVTR